MKSLLIFLTLTASITIFAKEHRILEFTVKQAHFADAHVKNAGPASLVLNYEKAEVTLTVTRHFSCPAGQMCAQMMPAPLVVQLPVVSVTSDSCGLRTVTAKQDSRPVDGMLQEIKVTDSSRMTCKTFVAVEPTAIYKTAFFDRMSGKAVQDESTMTLAFKVSSSENEVFETSLAPPILVEYVQNSGFSPEPTTNTVYIDGAGRVMAAVQSHTTGLNSQKELARLSPAALASLQRGIESIDVKLKLIDRNEGQPQCTDAPTSAVVAFIAGAAQTLSQNAGCHSFEVNDVHAIAMSELMHGLVGLSR